MNEYKMGKQEILDWHKQYYQHYGSNYYVTMEQRLDEYISLKENPDECRGVVDAALEFDVSADRFRYPWED